METILQQLAQGDCPSIAYRTRKELLRETLDEATRRQYRRDILQQPKVQRVLSWQMPDGYFGTRLHTAPSHSKVWPHEGCVSFLLEAGLTEDFEALKKSLDILLLPGWNKEAHGSAAETFGYGLIRACLFAKAGRKNEPFVHHWTGMALKAFGLLERAKDIDDLCREGRGGKRIFHDGVFVPTLYHLRLLAFTDSWRTPDNILLIKKAYEKLYEWLPLPAMYMKGKSSPVAPLGNVVWPVNREIQKEYGSFWFQFYELSARMGMLGKDSPFRRHFDALLSQLPECGGWFAEKGIKKDAYINWTAYSGLALYGDWESKQRKYADFAFRTLLIHHYAQQETVGAEEAS